MLVDLVAYLAARDWRLGSSFFFVFTTYFEMIIEFYMYGILVWFGMYLSTCSEAQTHHKSYTTPNEMLLRTIYFTVPGLNISTKKQNIENDMHFPVPSLVSLNHKALKINHLTLLV